MRPAHSAASPRPWSLVAALQAAWDPSGHLEPGALLVTQCLPVCLTPFWSPAVLLAPGALLDTHRPLATWRPAGCQRHSCCWCFRSHLALSKLLSAFLFIQRTRGRSAPSWLLGAVFAVLRPLGCLAPPYCSISWSFNVFLTAGAFLVIRCRPGHSVHSWPFGFPKLVVAFGS